MQCHPGRADSRNLQSFLENFLAHCRIPKLLLIWQNLSHQLLCHCCHFFVKWSKYFRSLCNKIHYYQHVFVLTLEMGPWHPKHFPRNCNIVQFQSLSAPCVWLFNHCAVCTFPASISPVKTCDTFMGVLFTLRCPLEIPYGKISICRIFVLGIINCKCAFFCMQSPIFYIECHCALLSIVPSSFPLLHSFGQSLTLWPWYSVLYPFKNGFYVIVFLLCSLPWLP